MKTEGRTTRFFISLLNANTSNVKLLKTIENAQQKLYDIILSILNQNENRLNNDGCLIELIDSQQNHFTYKATSLLEEDFESACVPVAETLAVKLSVGQNIVCCGDISEVLYDTESAWFKSGINSVIFIPLFYDMHKIGYYVVVSKQLNAFSEKEAQKAKIIAGFINAAFTDTIRYLLKAQKDIMIEDCEIQLEIAEERQALIFNSIHDAIIILDLENKIVDWNPAAKTIFGYDKKDVIGRTLEVLLRPQDRYLAQEISECINGQKQWQGELYIVKKDNSEVYYEMSIMPLQKDNGQTIALLSIGRDITERFIYAQNQKKEKSDLQSKINLLEAALKQVNQSIIVTNNNSEVFSNNVYNINDINTEEWVSITSDNGIIYIKK